MTLIDVPLFGMLRTKLSWLNDRQSVIAKNVANSSTPGFVARDVERLSFGELLDGAKQGRRSTGFVEHERVHLSRDKVRFRVDDAMGSETTPNGNNVSLENEMMKSTQTQMEYQAAIDIYKRGLGMIKMAVKKQ